ncbi:hypothetical protein [Inquilinus limosus]|uniref:Uncharacterized protein n=1 Tax=Inquilinus limosus TaxID=171674 RepID=A0A211Z3M5_9PROT|nr:hypothetical protein [Inquilinus limosus]OWJ59871.1 hypothetical protein BWR60_32020 [Inquilinus limosus]
MQEATAAILASIPELSATQEEAAVVRSDNLPEWVETWESRYGANIPVPRMSMDQHDRIDPLSEAAEKVHPSKILGVRS